jgi:RNA polymerase sigma factor (sigma-70 family)
MEPQSVNWNEIVDRMMAAEPQAVTTFTLYFSEFLRREYLSRRVPSHIAEDIAIECTYRLASRIHQFDPSRGSLEAWARGAGLNALRDWSRANRHQSRIPYFDSLPSRLGPGDTRSDEITQFVIQQALLHLSSTDQKIIELRFREDLTHRQIAEILGLSHESIRQHYVRALSRLRKLLRRDERFQARLFGKRHRAFFSSVHPEQD